MENRTYGIDPEYTIDELYELYGSASNEELSDVLIKCFPSLAERIDQLEKAIVEARTYLVNLSTRPEPASKELDDYIKMYRILDEAYPPEEHAAKVRST